MIGNRHLGSLALVILGTVGIISLYFIQSDRPKLRLLELPIVLRSGQITTPPFSPDTTYEYFATIYFRDGKNPHDLVCIIGSGIGYPFDLYKCEAHSILNIHWALLHEKKIIAHGEASNWSESGVLVGRNGIVTRIIGEFRGVRNSTYVLNLNIRHDALSLQKFHPLLVVEATPTLSMRNAYLVPLVAYVSVLALVLGAVFLSVDVLKHHARNRYRRPRRVERFDGAWSGRTLKPTARKPHLGTWRQCNLAGR